MKNEFRIICMLFFSFSYGQTGGESIYEFLDISTSARQVALGGKVLTLMDDVNQPLWNPATINVNLDNQLSVNYANYLSGINIGSVSFAHMVSPKFGVIHSGITYLDYGKIIGTDLLGGETGVFKAYDLSVSVGYAYQIPQVGIYLGSNLKVINSSIENFSSVGIAADFSILYYKMNKPFVLTCVVRNLGTQISTFNGMHERLPFEIELGGSYRLAHVPLKWYITIDNLQQWNVSASNPSNATIDLDGRITEENITFVGNAMRHFVVGAELFPESTFNFRFGYNFRRAKELGLVHSRTFAGISLGFGLKMKKIKLNYAYSKIHPVSNVSTFGLEIDLNK